MKEKYDKEQLFSILLAPLELAHYASEKSGYCDEFYRQRLRLNNFNDWKIYRACVDLLVDTEYAIDSGFMYQLKDISLNNRDYGEMHLRLYGILNAIFLQIGAFKKLADLLKYKDGKSAIISLFRNLDIYKLRGIAGAHTIDYEYPGEDKMETKDSSRLGSFRILQVDLSKTGEKITALDQNDRKFEFNLLKVLTEYEKVATQLVIDLIKKCIDYIVYKKEYKIELRKRLDLISSNLVNKSDLDENLKYMEEIIKRPANTK